LFPNEAAAKNLVPGKQTVTIPAAGDEFRFRVRPPFGAEVVQVLATLQPLAELDQLVQKTGRAAVVPGSVLAALAARLPREPTGWTEHRVPVRTLAKEALPPARAASRVGLFIGVNKYQDEKMCSPGERFRLGAELMAKTLVERGGIEAKHAKTIIAEQATKANIQEAIVRWLPSVSQPGDTVFVFYAGHGGTLKNLDGSKPDGRDGLLTTFDNDLGSGIKSQEEYDARSRRKMITDDALARWLQELPGRQIVLLLSTCHAGAQIDAQVLSKFFAQQAARVKGISQLNVAVVAGCAPDESGYSDPSKPVWMAYYMAEAMQRQTPPVTLRQAYEHYRQGQKQFLEELSKKFQSRVTGIQDPMFIENTLLPIVLVAGGK
jgi:hypothetical protein